MQEVLQHIQENYVSSNDTESGVKFSKLGVVGDQGSVERAANVLLQLRNGFDANERLENMHVELGDFHTGMKFLQVSYFFKVFSPNHHPQANSNCTLF